MTVTISWCSIELPGQNEAIDAKSKKLPFESIPTEFKASDLQEFSGTIDDIQLTMNDASIVQEDNDNTRIADLKKIVAGIRDHLAKLSGAADLSRALQLSNLNAKLEYKINYDETDKGFSLSVETSLHIEHPVLCNQSLVNTVYYSGKFYPQKTKIELSRENIVTEFQGDTSLLFPEIMVAAEAVIEDNFKTKKDAITTALKQEPDTKEEKRTRKGSILERAKTAWKEHKDTRETTKQTYESALEKYRAAFHEEQIQTRKTMPWVQTIIELLIQEVPDQKLQAAIRTQLEKPDSSAHIQKLTIEKTNQQPAEQLAGRVMKLSQHLMGLLPNTTEWVRTITSLTDCIALVAEQKPSAKEDTGQKTLLDLTNQLLTYEMTRQKIADPKAKQILHPQEIATAIADIGLLNNLLSLINLLHSENKTAQLEILAANSIEVDYRKAIQSGSANNTKDSNNLAALRQFYGGQIADCLTNLKQNTPQRLINFAKNPLCPEEYKPVFYNAAFEQLLPDGPVATRLELAKQLPQQPVSKYTCLTFLLGEQSAGATAAFSTNPVDQHIRLTGNSSDDLRNHQAIAEAYLELAKHTAFEQSALEQALFFYNAILNFIITKFQNDTLRSALQKKQQPLLAKILTAAKDKPALLGNAGALINENSSLELVFTYLEALAHPTPGDLFFEKSAAVIKLFDLEKQKNIFGKVGELSQNCRCNVKLYFSNIAKTGDLSQLPAAFLFAQQHSWEQPTPDQILAFFPNFKEFDATAENYFRAITDGKLFSSEIVRVIESSLDFQKPLYKLISKHYPPGSLLSRLWEALSTSDNVFVKMMLADAYSQEGLKAENWNEHDELSGVQIDADAKDHFITTLPFAKELQDQKSQLRQQEELVQKKTNALETVSLPAERAQIYHSLFEDLRNLSSQLMDITVSKKASRAIATRLRSALEKNDLTLLPHPFRLHALEMILLYESLGKKFTLEKRLELVERLLSTAQHNDPSYYSYAWEFLAPLQTIDDLRVHSALARYHLGFHGQADYCKGLNSYNRVINRPEIENLSIEIAFCSTHNEIKKEICTIQHKRYESLSTQQLKTEKSETSLTGSSKEKPLSYKYFELSKHWKALATSTPSRNLLDAHQLYHEAITNQPPELFKKLASLDAAILEDTDSKATNLYEPYQTVLLNQPQRIIRWLQEKIHAIDKADITLSLQARQTLNRYIKAQIHEGISVETELALQLLNDYDNAQGTAVEHITHYGQILSDYSRQHQEANINEIEQHVTNILNRHDVSSAQDESSAKTAIENFITKKRWKNTDRNVPEHLKEIVTQLALAETSEKLQIEKIYKTDGIQILQKSGQHNKVDVETTVKRILPSTVTPETLSRLSNEIMAKLLKFTSVKELQDTAKKKFRESFELAYRTLELHGNQDQPLLVLTQLVEDPNIILAYCKTLKDMTVATHTLTRGHNPTVKTVKDPLPANWLPDFEPMIALALKSLKGSETRKKATSLVIAQLAEAQRTLSADKKNSCAEYQEMDNLYQLFTDHITPEKDDEAVTKLISQQLLTMHSNTLKPGDPPLSGRAIAFAIKKVMAAAPQDSDKASLVLAQKEAVALAFIEEQLEVLEKSGSSNQKMKASLEKQKKATEQSLQKSINMLQTLIEKITNSTPQTRLGLKK